MNEQLYGGTYSTDSYNFGEITDVFPVEADWDGYKHHGYCWVILEVIVE